jgi:hypothetical protein
MPLAATAASAAWVAESGGGAGQPGEDFGFVKRRLGRAGANEPAVGAGHLAPPVTRRPGSHSKLSARWLSPLIMRNGQTPKGVLG